MSFEPSKRSGVLSFEDDASPLSQVIRRVKRDGPQHVSVEGLGEVVVLSTDDFSRLKGGATGQLLLDAFAASPYRDVDIPVDRGSMPVRDVPS